MPSYNSYMRQMSVLDNDDDITWITVKGNHIPIKKGQSKGDAVKEFFESKKSGEKKTITKSTSKNLKRSWKSEGSGKAKYKVGQKVSVGGKEYEVSAVKSANLSKEPYYKLSNGEWRHENEIKESDKPKVDSVKARNALRSEIKNTFFAEKARLYGYEGPEFVESENDGVLTLGVRDISGKSKIASVVKSLKNFWKFDVETETGEKGYTYFIFKGEKK